MKRERSMEPIETEEEQGQGQYDYDKGSGPGQPGLYGIDPDQSAEKAEEQYGTKTLEAQYCPRCACPREDWSTPEGFHGVYCCEACAQGGKCTCKQGTAVQSAAQEGGE